MRKRKMDSYKSWVKKLSEFLKQYRWLLDAYVIEFFTEDHWSKLPPSWQDSLRNANPVQISRLLLSTPFNRKGDISLDRVYPLSLLAFVATAHTLSVTREPSLEVEQQQLDREEIQQRDGASKMKELCEGKKKMKEDGIEKLQHVFRRHVKPKKQHEIISLGREIMDMVKVTGCKNIIDVGSGQGHLARYLAYHCGLNVWTVDAVSCHLEAAAKFDSEVEKDLLKKKRGKEVADGGIGGSIVHVEYLIQPGVLLEELLSQLGLSDEEHHTSASHSEPKNCTVDNHNQSQYSLGQCSGSVLGKCSGSVFTLPERETRYILVGLHTCGDLASTLLRVYTQSNDVVGVLSVGCCFMKLSCPGEEDGDDKTTSTTILESPEVDFDCKHSPGARVEIESSLRVVKTHHHCDIPHHCKQDMASVDTAETGRESTSRENGDHCANHLPLTVERTLCGYPMSQSLLDSPYYDLSYEAREVACHSIDSYREKLADSAAHHVKVHCHRAVVETILRKHGLRRSQVKISRRISRLPFTQYATAILEGLKIPVSDLNDGETLTVLLDQWRVVAVFFMLRLTLAPCVESLIMIDRLLYLNEQGLNVKLKAVFDAALSPRNQLIVSHKQ